MPALLAKSEQQEALIIQEKINYLAVNCEETELTKPNAISKDPHEIHNGKSSVLSVLFNFLNITVGIGILSLPYAMVTTGLFSTIICLILFGAMCAYTLNILVISAQKVSVFNYEGLGEYCYGSFGYIVSSFFMFVMVFGGLITEFIAIGDAGFKIMQLWGYEEAWQRMVIMVTISTVFVLPFCLFRDLSKLERMSALKVISVLFIITVVAHQWYFCSFDMDMIMSNMDMNQFTVLNINGLPKTMGIIAFSFLCHDCVFLMYNTLERPTLPRWQKVSGFGIAGTVGLNLFFAIPAFLTWGDDSDPNVINNYSVTNPLFIAVRVVIIVIMALSYPPAFFVVRHIVYSSAQRAYASFQYSFRSSPRNVMRYHSDIDVQSRAVDMAQQQMFYTVQNAPLCHHICFTLLVFFSNLGIALCIDNLGIAMSIIGSVSSMNLELVLPSLFYIKICVEDATMFDPLVWNDASFVRKGYLMARNGLFIPLCLVVIGIVLAITGVLSSFDLI
eukprot:107131_1